MYLLIVWQGYVGPCTYNISQLSIFRFCSWSSLWIYYKLCFNFSFTFNL